MKRQPNFYQGDLKSEHIRSRNIHWCTISDCDKVRSGQRNPKRQKEKPCEHLRRANTKKSARNQNMRKYSSNKFLTITVPKI